MDKKELAKFIGSKIRMYRMKMNLTQDQLGKKLNTKKLQFRITKLDIELLNKTIYSKLHIF